MTRTAIVRPVSWMNAAITIGILLICVGVGHLLVPDGGIVLGAVCYLVMSVVLRTVLCRHHRAAIRHCRRLEYAEAIPDFRRSVEFFGRHPWLDRFRAITLLSAARMSYREMGWVSLGFCYGQVGDGANARLCYHGCLAEYPGNEMAQAALRLMDAAAGQSPAREPTA